MYNMSMKQLWNWLTPIAWSAAKKLNRTLFKEMTNQSQEQSKSTLTWRCPGQLLKAMFFYQLLLTFLMRSSPLAQTSFTLSLWTVKSVSNASCFFSKPCKYKNKSKNFHIWKQLQQRFTMFSTVMMQWNHPRANNFLHTWIAASVSP